jgi:hypothetical protein
LILNCCNGDNDISKILPWIIAGEGIYRAISVMKLGLLLMRLLMNWILIDSATDAHQIFNKKLPASPEVYFCIAPSRGSIFWFILDNYVFCAFCVCVSVCGVFLL